MDRSGKDFKLLSTFFLLSLALSNKVSASSDLRHPCNSPCLLISTPTRILAVDYGNQSSFAVISNLSNANGYYVDVHYKLGYLFWSDRTERKIKRSNMDGTNITVIHNDTNCVGLAVEWNSMRLYWTENIKKTISVSDLEGNNRNIVLSTTDYPRGIAVDPQQGLMFWAAMSKIEKSNLDGTQRDIIVSSNLSSAHSITVDRKRKRVFWVDYIKDQIESVNYSGSNRVLLSRIQGVINLFGIAFTSSFLFVGEWHGNTVFKVNASNGTVVSSVQFASSAPSGSRGIYGYDSTLQPPATCPALPAPTDGAILGCPRNASVNYDTVCQFLCNNRYLGHGSQERRCLLNGTWSGQEFVCQTVTCPLPINAVFLGCKTGETEIINGTECRFSCKEESKVAGSTARRCIKDGKWSGAELACTAYFSKA
nr:low-density lipoprotein receptor-related protein 6-like isoform X2 [Pocillopora verrucosa]